MNLAAIDPRDTPGFSAGKDEALDALTALGERLEVLQEKLYAQGTAGASKRLLLVLQGMDTSGKGGTIQKVAGPMNPQGVTVASFKRPTQDELAHDFLWRVERQLPDAGQVGIFDRSHYEDVLIAKVRSLAEPAEIERRYGAINAFEEAFVASGGTVVKCLLHIDRDVQAERLLARLDDPTKHWKFSPGDIDERALWDDYMTAYQTMVDRCSTDDAPWYVIPAGRKWYRNWAVAQLVADALEAMDLQWPEADFDVEQQRARLLAT